MQWLIARAFFTSSMIIAVACTQPASEKAPAENEANTQETTTEQESHTGHSDAQAAIERTPSQEGAKVFFKNVSDGDEVASPVKLEFGIEKMTVAKAGVDEENSGHHHLIVDADLPPMDAPIPSSDNYIHFGDGSTSTELELDPGEHTVRLLLGDHRHIPHEPPVMSEPITITVK